MVSTPGQVTGVVGSTAKLSSDSIVKGYPFYLDDDQGLAKHEHKYGMFY
jgi:hypothetical protein